MPPLPMPTLPMPARLRLAWRALFARLEPGSVGAQLFAGIFPQRGEPPTKNTQDFLRAYSTMPWLRAVVHRVAGAVAATNWRLYAARNRQRRYYQNVTMQYAPKAQRWELLKAGLASEEVEEITEHPLLTLLRQGNPMLNGINTRRLLQIHLDLVGESFWILQRNQLKMPTGVWPIPPSWVLEVPTVKNPAYRVQFQGWSGMIPETEVVAFYDPNPANPYGRGRGTAQALADELDTDEYAAKHVKAWFFNRARPDLIVTADGLNPDDTQRLEEDWLSKSQGFWRAWKPYFMSRKVDIHELSQTFENMQLVPLRASERDTIVTVYGVPPETLGILTNSNRATIESADYHFAKYVQIPRLELLREVMQNRLVPEFDERLILDYDTPMMEDKEYRLNVARAAPWSLLVDEWRELMDYEPLENDRGRVVAVPLNLVFTAVADLAGESSSAPAATTPLAASQNGHANGDIKTAPHPRSTKTLEEESRQALHVLADRLAPGARRQFLRLIGRLKNQTALEDVQAAAARGDLVGVVDAIPWQQMPQEFQDLGTTLRQAFNQSGDLAAETLSQVLEVEVSFDLASPTAIEAARTQAAELVTNITDASREAIRQMVERAVEEGMPPGELAERVINTIGLTPRQEAAVARFEADLSAQGVDATVRAQRVQRYRAAQLRQRGEVIARTELLRSANLGHQEAWTQAVRDGLLNGEQWRKVWIVTPDDRLDTTVCEPVPYNAANQDVPIDGYFTLGNGSKVQTPPGHPLCRCVVSLRRKS